jgi:hypothetical protein
LVVKVQNLKPPKLPRITVRDGVEASAGFPPKGSTPSALDVTTGSITEQIKLNGDKQSPCSNIEAVHGRTGDSAYDPVIKLRED